MLKGISKTETVEYISEEDPARNEVEGATIFLVGAIDVNLKTHLQDMGMAFNAEGLIQNRSNFKVTEAARFGLRGWRNFKDEAGNDIPFTTSTRIVNGKVYQYITDECAGMIPFRLLSELGRRVLIVNSMVNEQGFMTP